MYQIYTPVNNTPALEIPSHVLVKRIGRPRQAWENHPAVPWVHVRLHPGALGRVGIHPDSLVVVPGQGGGPQPLVGGEVRPRGLGGGHTLVGGRVQPRVWGGTQRRVRDGAQRLGLGGSHQPRQGRGSHPGGLVRARPSRPRVGRAGPLLPSGAYPVLLHVHVQAVLLGEGRVAQLALVGLLPRVQPLVDLQVVGHGEALAALAAHEGADARVEVHVRGQLVPPQKDLGAEVALELLVLDVHVDPVPAQHVLVEEALAAQLADVGSRPRLRAVPAERVVQEAAMARGGVGAELAHVLLLHVLPVALHVVVERALLREGRPACVAQVVLVPLEEQRPLVPPQTPAAGAQRLARDLFVRADANVLGEFPMVVDDGVTRQALVASAVTILVLKNTRLNKIALERSSG